MIYALHIGLAVTAFLVVLNGLLRGSLKAQIDAALGLALVGLLGAGFLLLGWKAGTLALVLAFLYGRLARPLAARVASKLMSLSGPGTTRHYVGLPDRGLARISRELGRELSTEQTRAELTGASNRREKAMTALFSYCEQNPSVAGVMAEHGVTRGDLEQMYGTLLAIGAGQWAGGHFVAASAMAHAEPLRYLLGARSAGTTHTAQLGALVDYFESGVPLP